MTITSENSKMPKIFQNYLKHFAPVFQPRTSNSYYSFNLEMEFARNCMETSRESLECFFDSFQLHLDQVKIMLKNFDNDFMIDKDSCDNRYRP